MVFLFPYAYDRMPDGKPTKGVAPKRLGTKARIDALTEKAPTDDEVWFWVLVAGFTKNIYWPTKEIPTSIAQDMLRYLTSRGFGNCVGLSRCAWGTYEETIQAIEFIKEIDAKSGIEIWVSTNLGHMPRVRLCWFFLKPKGWKVHFIRANHSFSKKEWLQETAKFFGYLYRFLLRKW